MNDREDYAQAVPRCPRCLDHDQVERTGGWGHRWICPACDLVFVGTVAEQHAESRRRAEIDAELAKRADRGAA